MSSSYRSPLRGDSRADLPPQLSVNQMIEELRKEGVPLPTTRQSRKFYEQQLALLTKHGAPSPSPSPSESPSESPHPSPSPLPLSRDSDYEGEMDNTDDFFDDDLGEPLETAKVTTTSRVSTFKRQTSASGKVSPRKKPLSPRHKKHEHTAMGMPIWTWILGLLVLMAGFYLARNIDLSRTSHLGTSDTAKPKVDFTESNWEHVLESLHIAPHPELHELIHEPKAALSKVADKAEAFLSKFKLTDKLVKNLHAAISTRKSLQQRYDADFADPQSKQHSLKAMLESFNKKRTEFVDSLRPMLHNLSRSVHHAKESVEEAEHSWKNHHLVTKAEEALLSPLEKARDEAEKVLNGHLAHQHKRKADLHEHEVELQRLNHDIPVLDKQIADTQRKIQSIEDNVLVDRQSIIETDELITTVSNEIDHIHKKIHAFEEYSHELERLDKVTRRVSGVKADLHAKTADLQSVRSELETLRRASESHTDPSAVAEHDPLLEKIRKYQSDMKDLITEGAEHNLKAIEQFEKEVHSLEGLHGSGNVRHELKERITTLKKQLPLLQQSLADHKRKKAELEKHRDGLQKEVNTLTSSLHALQAKHSNMNSKLSDLGHKISELKREISLLSHVGAEEALTKAVEKLEAARAKIHAKTEEGKTIQSRLKDAQHKLAAAQKALRVEIDNARYKVHGLVMDRTGIEAGLHKLKKAASSEKEELKAALHKMDDEIHSMMSNIKHHLFHDDQ